MHKNNALYKSCALFALIFAFAIFLFLDAKSETEKSKYEYYKEVKSTVNDIKTHEINPEMDYLGQYFTLRTTIVDKLKDNKEDMRDGIFDALGGPKSALISLGKQISDTMDGVQLMAELDHVNKSAEKFIKDNIVPIYQRKGDQKKLELMGYNEAFAELVTAYNALDDEYTKRANTALFGSATATSDKVDLYQTSLYSAVPDAGSVFLVKCNGKCYGYWEDADKMKVTCPSCGVEYYSCDKKKAHYHSKPAGSDKYNCEPELSISLNKSFFSFDEELVVNIKMRGRGIQSAYLQFAGQVNPKVPSSSPLIYLKPLGVTYIGEVTITTGFSELNFNGSSEWYGDVNITVLYTKADGSNGQTSFSRYISVEKVGYFDKGNALKAYDTYEANIIESGPITNVLWMIKKPGGKWKSVKIDDVKNGNSSSFSYSTDSTTGTYEVYVWFYDKDGKLRSYSSSFTVSSPSTTTTTTTTPTTTTPTVSLPVWSGLGDTWWIEVGSSFSFDLSMNVTGSPTITMSGGSIPAGFNFSNGVLSGTGTTVGASNIRFTATNAAGSVDSKWIKIIVYE